MIDDPLAITCINLLLFLAITIIIVIAFVKKDTPFVYVLIVTIPLFLGFFALSYLPIDIAILSGNETINDTYMLSNLWLVIYWTTFIFSWIILPVVSEYYLSGSLTFCGRFTDALKSNLKFYGILTAILLVGLILVSITTSIQLYSFSSTIISIGNTFGLVIIVFLMSYGLVEFPKFIWNMGDYNNKLRKLAFMFDYIEQDYLMAQNDIRALKLILANFNNDSNEKIKTQVTYLLNKITKLEVPDGAKSVLAPEKYKNFETVNRKAKAGIETYQLAKLKYVKTLKEFNSFSNRKQSILCVPLKYIFRILGFITYCASLLTLFCELSITINYWGINVSPYSTVLAKSNNIFARYLFCVLTFWYLAIVTYYPLFKSKLYNIFSKVFLLPELHIGRSTSVIMLITTAIFMCRLQFPLSFNYISMTQYDKLVPVVINNSTIINNTTVIDTDVNLLNVQQSTGFMNTLGTNMELDVIDIYLPVLLCIMTFITYFKLIDRLLICFKIDFAGEPITNNLDHESKIKDNLELLKRARLNI